MSSNANETSAEVPQLQPDLPSPRLPPEILDRILDHIDGKTWSFYSNPTRIDYGRSISLVCRAWRERGTAWVWSRVDLNLTTRDKTLEHMLAYPRTAKGLEMLYIDAKLLWSQCSKYFELEAAFDSHVKQVYRDMRQLMLLCRSLRELQMMFVPGELLDALFPPESTCVYPSIEVITLQAFSRTDGDTFMRMLHAAPNIGHLNVPGGRLVLVDVESLDDRSAIVRPLPKVHLRDLYLDWRPGSYDIVVHYVFKHVLPAVDPSTLGQISLAPIEKRTMPLLFDLLPHCAKLDYLSVIYQDQNALHESFEAFVAILRHLPNLRALEIRSYDPAPATVQTEISSDLLAFFFRIIPGSIRTLQLHVLLSPVAANSSDLPDEILEYLKTRADTLLRSVECRFRRPEQVVHVDLSRDVWTPEGSLHGEDEDVEDDEAGGDEAEDEAWEDVDDEDEVKQEEDADGEDQYAGNRQEDVTSGVGDLWLIDIDAKQADDALSGHLATVEDGEDSLTTAADGPASESPAASAASAPSVLAAQGDATAAVQPAETSSVSEAGSFDWGCLRRDQIKRELKSLYPLHDNVVRDCPRRRQHYGHGWSLEYECWIGLAGA